MKNLSFKTCKCCGFKTFQMLKRKCPTCGVPAVWEKQVETDAQSKSRDQSNAEKEATLDWLLS